MSPTHNIKVPLWGREMLKISVSYSFFLKHLTPHSTALKELHHDTDLRGPNSSVLFDSSGIKHADDF